MRHVFMSMLLGSGITLAQAALANDALLFKGAVDRQATARLEQPSSLPVDVLTEGLYENRDGYFTDFEITRWADVSIATGYVWYGTTPSRFEVELDDNEGNEFRGNGFIYANYGVQTCRYPIGIKILAYEDGLYIRSRNPASLPMQAPLGGCYAPGQINTYRHPSAYVLVEDGE